jgi:hypothetical protein
MAACRPWAAAATLPVVGFLGPNSASIASPRIAVLSSDCARSVGSKVEPSRLSIGRRTVSPSALIRCRQLVSYNPTLTVPKVGSKPRGDGSDRAFSNQSVPNVMRYSIQHVLAIQQRLLSLGGVPLATFSARQSTEIWTAETRAALAVSSPSRPLIRLASLFVLYLDQRRKRKGALHRFGHSLGLDAIIVVRSRRETTLGRTLFDAAVSGNYPPG